MNHKIKKLIYPLYNLLNNRVVRGVKRKMYLNGGRKPWSRGYNEHKHFEINSAISNAQVLEAFRNGKAPENFGVGVDERIFEYTWIFSRLDDDDKKMLDAGSTFNYKYLLEHSAIVNREVTIFTFYPEVPSFKNKKGKQYVYGDLRKMELRSEAYDLVVSQSTIEHIDMDNNIYGYDISKNDDVNLKSYDYLLAVKEMLRVMKPNGKLLLTFPFGIFKNYGFFQQFDNEMVDKLTDLLDDAGSYTVEYGLYKSEGWNFAKQAECSKSLSFNPHTGQDQGTDGAAHCRSVCLIEFIKE